MSDATAERLDRFTAAASAGSAQVIRVYSTSFGWATALLGPRVRHRVRDVYALVRLADEIVDGVPAEAGLDAQACAEELDALEAATRQALRVGYSTNLVVHAFAVTARTCGIDEHLTGPFFASMRRDLGAGEHTPASHQEYVYGSAQVVGLMCLEVFLHGQDVDAAVRKRLARAAERLGAAFQNVNFLRDLADDTERLGRRYLGDVGPYGIDEGRKKVWVDRVRGDLDAAAAVIPLLPADCRAAVRCALQNFAALTHRIDRTPVAELARRRVRVHPARRALIVGAAAARRIGRVR